MAASCVGRTTGLACIALFACVAYALASGRLTVVRVSGGSMSPALWPGDVCLVTRAASLAVSDVVLYVPPGHTGRVLHRVRSLEGSGIVTQGDANPIRDREPVPRSVVLGKVSAVMPIGHAVSVWQRGSGR